jgi:hypothetical protein
MRTKYKENYKYFPLYELNNNNYSAYLDFCIRSFCNNWQYWYITKDQFRNDLKIAWFERKTILNIWNKWWINSEYSRWITNNKLYIKKRNTKVMPKIHVDFYSKVNSMNKFKQFVTLLQAWRMQPYWNRGRTLTTIWKRVWTNWKQTVSRRIKKANKYFKNIDVIPRYTKINDKIARLSNNYNLHLVKFTLNRFHPTFKKSLEIREKVREIKKNLTKIQIINLNWYDNFIKHLDNNLYLDYANWFWKKIY